MLTEEKINPSRKLKISKIIKYFIEFIKNTYVNWREDQSIEKAENILNY
jgi:hypothetical protein